MCIRHLARTRNPPITCGGRRPAALHRRSPVTHAEDLRAHLGPRPIWHASDTTTHGERAPSATTATWGFRGLGPRSRHDEGDPARASREHRSPIALVELRGLEPLTPTLPVWCATSCATAPYRPRSPGHGGNTTHPGRLSS